MKVNPKDPAMPIKDIGFNVEIEEIAMHEQHADFKVNFPGMSIRTELAARAMQGLLSGVLANPKLGLDDFIKREFDFSKAAVVIADELIAELNKLTE